MCVSYLLSRRYPIIWNKNITIHCSFWRRTVLASFKSTKLNNLDKVSTMFSLLVSVNLFQFRKYESTNCWGSKTTTLHSSFSELFIISQLISPSVLQHKSIKIHLLELFILFLFSFDSSSTSFLNVPIDLSPCVACTLSSSIRTNLSSPITLP